jgi:hypothetical protein
VPFVYDLSLATAGNTTTNGSGGTENNTFTIKTGAANCALQSMYVLGKGAGLTAISGIVHRIVHWATASTSGTGITPVPKDSRLQGVLAAKAVCASGATNGSTRTNKVVFGCGAAGPGGWVAPNPDSLESMIASGSDSLDALNASGTVSLGFEWSAEIVE